MAYMPTLTNKK